MCSLQGSGVQVCQSKQNWICICGLENLQIPATCWTTCLQDSLPIKRTAAPATLQAACSMQVRQKKKKPLQFCSYCMLRWGEKKPCLLVVFRAAFVPAEVSHVSGPRSDRCRHQRPVWPFCTRNLYGPQPNNQCKCTQNPKPPEWAKINLKLSINIFFF